MRLNKSPLCCGNSIITGNPCRNYAGTGDFCRYHQEQISGKNKYGVPITQKYASQNNFCYNHKSTPSDNQNVIHQCEGITVIGERCKNKYKYRGKYCHIHNESIEEIENNKFKEKDFLNESLKVEITDDLILGSTPLDMTHQCERITKLGNRCKNKFKYQGKFCHQHNKFAEKLNNALFVPGFGKRKYYSIDGK
ncbi:MAG TPA: hypothetical protein VJ697_08170 [Nitrososphaeraceae archaeon]|nr:hypothetical protein [Nitrososphaeraceae archaeon]